MENTCNFDTFIHKYLSALITSYCVKLVLDGRLRLEIVNKIDATADNRF